MNVNLCNKINIISTNHKAWIKELLYNWSKMDLFLLVLIFKWNISILFLSQKLQWGNLTWKMILPGVIQVASGYSLITLKSKTLLLRLGLLQGNLSNGIDNKTVKVHIFWEGHKILQNLHLTFDYSTYSQK